MPKLALLLSLALAVATGSTIDYGVVYTAPYFVPDGTTVILNFGSTDGDFFLAGPGILGGADLNPGGSFCAQIGACNFGRYSIRASFPDASAYFARAFAFIDGGGMQSVIIGCNVSGCPDTLLTLTAQPIDVAAPGDYAVPFTVTGQIQATAADSPFGPLLLDQTVTGVGELHFTAIAVSSATFRFDRNILIWDFQPVPEPSLFLPGLVALAAIGWRLRTA